MRRVEVGLGLLLTAGLAALHVAFFASAGALWRDEVNSVNLASMSLPEFRANLQFDSFPVAWFALLRGWIAVGFGATDAGLRLLGLALGIGVLAVLWWMARRFGESVPWLALALLGANGAVIAYGDTIRGYGLGLLTGLIALGLLFELARRPSAGRAAGAALGAALSVQSLYYNAAVVLAACAGGAAVGVRRRSWKAVALIVGVGAIAAATLLPYRSVVTAQNAWNFVVKMPIDLPWVWVKFVEATASTGPLAFLPWIVLTPLAAAAGLLGALRPARNEADERRQDACLYCTTALTVGVITYLAFLLRLSYPMQPWYFLGGMALAAICIEGALPSGGEVRWRAARAGAALTLAALAVAPTWQTVRMRKTNLDLIAARIEALARAGDLVVLTPWYHGVTYARYHRSPASWVTLPPVAELRVHRYDLLRDAMRSPNVMPPVLGRIEAALKAGGKIWWVGAITAPANGLPPPDPPSAPSDRWGWDEYAYYYCWDLQAGALLRRHTRSPQRITIDSGAPVQPYEAPPLYVVEGWIER